MGRQGRCSPEVRERAVRMVLDQEVHHSSQWSATQSILWAILHGIFSWFYLLYFALTR